MEKTGADRPLQAITGIHGVVVIAEHYSEQVEFYRDVLGLKTVMTYSDATFFEAGSQTFAIFARGHHPEGDRALKGASHGLSHLEFRIAACDVAKMESQLYDFVVDPNRRHFRDVDGNIFHFVTQW